MYYLKLFLTPPHWSHLLEPTENFVCLSVLGDH